MDTFAISNLESGRLPNPTIETFRRYADAINKRPPVIVTDV